MNHKSELDYPDGLHTEESNRHPTSGPVSFTQPPLFEIPAYLVPNVPVVVSGAAQRWDSGYGVRQWPLIANSGHSFDVRQCPLLVASRTSKNDIEKI